MMQREKRRRQCKKITLLLAVLFVTAVSILWKLRVGGPIGEFAVLPDPSEALDSFETDAAGFLLNSAAMPVDAELRLDRLVYGQGDEISATLEFSGEAGAGDDEIVVFISSPGSGDVEILRMNPSDQAGRVWSEELPLPTAVARSHNPTEQLDGVLSVADGEIFYAIWIAGQGLSGSADAESVFSDFGIMSAGEDAGIAGALVLPELACFEEELASGSVVRPFGTLLPEGGLPVQMALDELIVAPRDRRQLDDFLSRFNARVIRTDLLPEEEGDREPRLYLVQVDATSVDRADLPVLRSALDQTAPVYGSSESVLALYTLALQARFDGYAVSVNPRLQPTGVPTISPAESGNLRRNMTDFGPMNVPRMWAYLAVWDRDVERIPLGVLDMGFAPNDDYREPLTQCDLEGDSLLDGFLRGVECGPGIAVRPPTVGNSFVGSLSWHGNGVVTTAGGIINGGWGSAGVGGQVVEPMLYRYGLASYAFEVGLGIRKAATDGASVINLSAGYPCRILTELGIGIGFCDPLSRVAICAVATGGLNASLDLICGIVPLLRQIPNIGVPLAAAVGQICDTAQGAVNIVSAACYATLLLGDLRDPMEEGVAFAKARGVPFVASAGNALSRDSLPEIVRDLIDIENQVADDWNFVPAVLPGVIAAGAVGDNWPFSNIHFYGPSVDLWAPIRSTYFSPPTTDAVTGSAQQTLKSFGGTSAAAPYICGLIACMQAVNPELNPNNPALSNADREEIVDRITSLLTENAWSNQELVELAPASFSNAVAAAAGERGNMINPLRTIRAAGEGLIPDLDALDYSDRIDFDETTAAAAADNLSNALALQVGDVYRGAIVTILGENGAPDLSDVDWYEYSVPAEPAGTHQARFQLRIPRGFGTLTTDTPGYEIAASAAASTAAEEAFYILGPALQAGASDAFRIIPVLDNDNVYKLSYESVEWVPGLNQPTQLAAAETRRDEFPGLPESGESDSSIRPSINFATTGPRTEHPRIDLSRTDKEALISWPDGPLRYVVESCGLHADARWTPLAGVPQTGEGFLYQKVSPDFSGRMFRLREIEPE